MSVRHPPRPGARWDPRAQWRDQESPGRQALCTTCRGAPATASNGPPGRRSPARSRAPCECPPH
eukprot:11206115-Lingulodinium_polyedra.AAC.1